MVDRTTAMIWTARPDATLDYLNGTCVTFSGLPMEKLLNNGWLDAVHPEDLERCASIYVPAFEARAPWVMEYRMRRADGAYRWLMASGVPYYRLDGSYAGYVGCDIDITERRDAEDRMRESRAALEASYREIQRQAGRLIEAQDAERARIARDLHDDLSQQLAGMSIALSGLKHRMEALHVNQDLLADLRALQQRSATLAQAVRQLSHDLHPTVLRHAGLLAALTSYCEELELSHRTVLMCSAEGDLTSIAPEVALCLYRVAQEALRNVVAHAEASRAEVRLTCTGDNIEMMIVDDGKGFDVARELERGKGLGLISIGERVGFLGGSVGFEADSSRGTSLRIQIAARPPVKTDATSGDEGKRRELSLS
jgi:PAS domain S-box-containing protein